MSFNAKERSFDNINDTYRYMTLKFGEPAYVLMPRQERPMMGTDQTTMEKKQGKEEEDIHKEKATELVVQMSEVNNCEMSSTHALFLSLFLTHINERNVTIRRL